jgi:PncC family amidohydrolase
VNRGAGGLGFEVDPLATRLGDRLRERRLSLGLAESCTGGMVASLVTDLPGSSAYFKGGIVSYSDAVKEQLLAVPGALLRERGAVSREVAKAMAEGVRERLGVDVGASVTGISGPVTSGTEKPVGLTYVAVAGPGRTRVEEFRFHGDRWRNRAQAATAVLTLLVEELEHLD